MKKRRAAMITVGIFIFLLIALEIFLCVWFFGAKYPEFDAIAVSDAEIEGLDEGFVPQGLGNTDSGELLVSGYLAKGGASRLYLLGEKSKYVTVSGEDGKALESHFGGVTCSGDNIYLTDGSKIVRLSLEKVASAAGGAAVKPEAVYETALSNAFCFVADGKLFAGEFYRAGNYETDASHHVEANGETNYAFVYAYALGADGSLSSPLYGYSVRGLVQGFAVCGGKVYLSCSYGLADSVLYCYQDPYGGEPFDTANGIPMYRLDCKNLETTLTMPSMSEGICVRGETLLVLFESDCSKYRLFVRRNIDNVMALPLGLGK